MSKSFQAYRIVVTLVAAAIFSQAVTAGMFLSAMSGGRPIHSMVGMVILLLLLVQLITAILVWRPGGGTARYIPPSAIMLVLAIAQMALGIAKVKLIHLPLGVLLWGGVLMMLTSVWASARKPVPA